MPGAVRSGVDAAGGIVTETGQDFVTVEASLWCTLGAPVASHGSSPHDSATMAAASTFVKVDGVAVCLAGHLATCGHAAAGSPDIGASE